MTSYEVIFNDDKTATIYWGNPDKLSKLGVPIIHEKTMRYLTAIKWMTRQGINWSWRKNELNGVESAYGAKEG